MRTGWFRWVLSVALCVLAGNMVLQVGLQKRILARGEALRETVAESRSISADLTEQLRDVQTLHGATVRMGEHLSDIERVNGSLRAEMEALDRTVAGIVGAVGRLESATQETSGLLGSISQQATRLQSTMRATLATGESLTANIGEMARIQSGINADLRELNVKTSLIGGR